MNKYSIRKHKADNGSIKRKFDGKFYTDVATVYSRADATKRAKAWRQQGYLVRVVRLTNSYDVYIRQK